MELYQALLAAVLARGQVNATFPELTIDAAEIVELQSYRALQQIKAIMEDDSLDDETCFQKVEEIVCLFEALGSDCKNRHDFG